MGEVHSFSAVDNPANWEKTLTVAYSHIEGREYPSYLVVGIKYEWNYSGSPDDRRTCDINLLTGRGELTSQIEQRVKTFSSSLVPESTDGWPCDMIPEQCFGG